MMDATCEIQFYQSKLMSNEMVIILQNQSNVRLFADR